MSLSVLLKSTSLSKGLSSKRLPARALSLLVVSSFATLASAQGVHARAPAPVQPEDALRAARYLEELHPGPTHFGVRLARDVDGDGDVDLLMLSRAGQNRFVPRGVETWLAVGGHYQLAATLAFTVGPDPESHLNLAQDLFLADVTGDGVLDLVYTRLESAQPTYWNYVGPSGVLVHPGLGGGSFGAAILIASGYPLGLAVGDCDGDGDDDLLVQWATSGQYRLEWWSFAGGVFTPSASLSVTSEPPTRLTILDLDQDGIADAVGGTNSGNDLLQAYLTVNGAPTFAGAVPIASGLQNINQHLHAGDLDGDGDEDVLVALQGFSQAFAHLQAFLWTPSGFVAAAPQDVPDPVVGFWITSDGALADWDEDGDADYVTPTFAWLENDGGAHFALAATRYSSRGSSTEVPLQVVDLDGDGHLDALASWMLVRGDGRMPQASSVPAIDTMTSVSGFAVEDFEGDGDLDYVEPGLVLRNAGDGTFSGPGGPSPFLGDQLALAGWGDFDGDGFRDIVAAESVYPTGFERMRFFAGREDGSGVATTLEPAPVQIGAPDSLSGDLDGDGDVDILVSNGYWPNDGSAHFPPLLAGAYLGKPRLARDFDADGDLDVVVLRGSALELWRQTTTLAFHAEPLGSASASTLPSFVDADQDGDLDLVVANPSDGMLWIHEELASGALAPRLGLAAPGVNGVAGQVDVDADGRLDLVFGRTGAAQLLSAWLRGPGLTFPERREYVVREAPTAFGDIDGDGDVDVIGRYLVENKSFDGPGVGHAVQYGLAAATAGTGGLHPLLGARAPLRLATKVGLELVNGRGAAVGVLSVGVRRTDRLAGGVHVLIDPVLALRTLALDGTPGAPGAGSATVSLPASLTLLDRAFTFQAVLVDPGASGGFSASNGLELTFGALRSAE